MPSFKALVLPESTENGGLWRILNLELFWKFKIKSKK
jgi:hypothetical protein